MRLFIAAFAVFCLDSCAQLTRLDTARTIGEGNTEIGAQLSAYGVDEIASPALGRVAAPYLVLEINRGLTEKLDLMISGTTAGSVFISPKYQLYGDRESSLAVSLLPGVDLQYVPEDSSANTGVFFRPHLSGIVSIHQDEWAFFVEPKYTYQYWTKTHFVGSTIGVDYSLPKFSFAVGVSYFPVLEQERGPSGNIFQLGFSVRKMIEIK